MDFVNDIINQLIGYLNMALGMVSLEITGTFDASGIIESITGLFGGLFG
ncbi:MAG: hypothetical protein FWG82_03790 [Oscillospiraceae bacterium]|nr:hypothetical protein [Oscillospiraceae bacterium]